MSDVTLILSEIENGDAEAADRLLPFVYHELRRLASASMANEANGHTLQATALVHEAYLRLVGSSKDQQWDGRGHFFAAAAEAMRRILVENARQKQQLKHGGGLSPVPLDDVAISTGTSAEEIVAIHDSLRLLENEDAAAATLVKLRYFAGMTLEEAAESLGISVRTAYRDWAYARAWLFRALGEAGHMQR